MPPPTPSRGSALPPPRNHHPAAAGYPPGLARIAGAHATHPAARSARCGPRGIFSGPAPGPGSRLRPGPSRAPVATGTRQSRDLWKVGAERIWLCRGRGCLQCGTGAAHGQALRGERQSLTEQTLILALQGMIMVLLVLSADSLRLPGPGEQARGCRFQESAPAGQGKACWGDGGYVVRD